MLKIKNKFKNTHFKPDFLELFKWLFIDFYRNIKNPKNRIGNFVKKSGIFIITGRTGGGKTTTAIKLVDDYVKKFGRENILIASNTDVADQDFVIDHWAYLSLFYNKPLVFIYDEANMDFPQNAYKNMDQELRIALAQNRKGKGKAIFAISQDYNMLLNEFRRLSKKVYWCKTLWGRLTRAKRYDTMEYEEMINNPDVNKKMKVRPEGKLSVVQTDNFRNKYSSFALVKSIKRPIKEFMINKDILPYIDTNMTDLTQYKLTD